MIGTNLGLDLPSLSDSLATIVSKVTVALSAIQDSIADLADPSALNINDAISMNGNALSGVSTVQFATGNASQVPGSLFYAAGEFFMVDVSGTPIQITANGLINIGGTGGFVGDYVSSNPTGAAYDLASTQFRFTKTVGGVTTPSDVSLLSAILNGAAGSVKIGVDAAINTARIANFKSLPGTGVSLLVYNAATSTIEDGNVTPPTNPLTSLTVATLTTTTDDKYSYVQTHAHQMAPAQASVNVTANDLNVTSTGTAWSYSSPIFPLRVGDRIKTYKLYWSAGSGNVVVKLKKQTATNIIVTVDTVTTSVPGSFTQTTSQTIASPVAAADGDRFYLEFTAGSASGDQIFGIQYTKDHP